MADAAATSDHEAVAPKHATKGGKAPRAQKMPKKAVAADAMEVETPISKTKIRGGKSHPNVPAKSSSKAGKPPSVEGETGKQRKKRRFRSGVVALRNIRKYQKGGELLLRKLPFMRLCREIAQDFAPPKGAEAWRFQAEAIEALQEASEGYITAMFDCWNRSCIFDGRVTVAPKDVKHVNDIGSRFPGVSSTRVGPYASPAATSS